MSSGTLDPIAQTFELPEGPMQSEQWQHVRKSKDVQVGIVHRQTFVIPMRELKRIEEILAVQQASTDKPVSVFAGPIPPAICAFAMLCVATFALVSGFKVVATAFIIFAGLFLAASITGALTKRLITQNRLHRRAASS